MTEALRPVRLDLLRRSQNRDGGWGYSSGKQSWLEPTCYALLALHKDDASRQAWERGWRLVKSWQRADGSWRAAAAVETPGWAGALAVTLGAVAGDTGDWWRRGVDWLLGARGNEGRWISLLLQRIRTPVVEFDRRFQGWSWTPDSASWVEPTAHSLVALKKAARVIPDARLSTRIDEGERMVVDRRSKDGGWNYGNRRVLAVDLPSYPETTALALLGLQGTRLVDTAPAVAVAEGWLKRTDSRLARAWLRVALRNYQRAQPEPDLPPAGDDLLLAALDAMGCEQGGHQWLSV